MKKIKNNRSSLLSLAIAFGLLATFVSSCGKDDLAAPTTTNAANNFSSRVKFFHAVADAPAVGVDILVDGQAVNLTKTITGRTGTFRDTLTYARTFPNDLTYLGYDPGLHNVKITLFNTPATVLTEANVTFDPTTNYSVFAADSAAKVSAVIFKDDIPTAVDKKAAFRFINLSPDVLAVDIVRIKGTDTLTLFTNIAYKSASPFIQVDTSVGTTGIFKTDYQIRPTGKTNSIRTWTAATFSNGSIYSLVSRGFVGKTGTLGINASLITHSR